MPQELTTGMMEPLKDKNEVRPFDKTTVYATGVGGFHAEGEALEVHPLLAAKLIEHGKATKEAPKKTEKPAK